MRQNPMTIPATDLQPQARFPDAAASARRVIVLALIVLAASGLAAAPADAAFPGQNGKIAFTSFRDSPAGEIYVMNDDGTGQLNRTNDPGRDEAPAWSPDGQKIAFQSGREGNFEIYVMNADGTGQLNRTNTPGPDHQPAWSPDGQQIAFTSNRDGNPEIYVMNANGTGQTRLTSNPSLDDKPVFSPDGRRIAFDSLRDGNLEIYVMNADGTGTPMNLTNNAAGDADPSWSPDGQTIAFGSDRDGGNVKVYVMSAEGTGTPTRLTNNVTPDVQPAWSPDGQKIAFESGRDGGNGEIYVMSADGTGTPTRLTNAASVAVRNFEPDWQPLPLAPQAACGNTRLQLGRAMVEGTLAETNPGSGVFRAGPGETVFVGGFELRPRLGGALLVDTLAPSLLGSSVTGVLREEGTGVDVFFGSLAVPLGLALIPLHQAEASFPINRDGTLLKSLFSLPVSGQLKATWGGDGGRSAALELEAEAEKLLGNFGSFTGAGVTAPALKLQAKQVNCTGFDFTGAEFKADELSFTPTKLKVPRKLGLKNILFKYEQDAGGLESWAGQGELILPIGGTGELAAGGKVKITAGKLAGVGLSTSGLNRSVGYGLFLQNVGGELAFEPKFGFDFGVGATLGPAVKGKKLVKLTGNLKGLELAPECTSGEDPVALVGTASVPLVEELEVGSVKFEGVRCLYTASLAIEATEKIDAVFGPVVNGEIPNPAVAVKGNISGFVGADGLNLEGGASVTLPLVGATTGQALISTKAFAACAGLGFVFAGVAHTWGKKRTDAFTGCDLAPWRAFVAKASAFSPTLQTAPWTAGARATGAREPGAPAGPNALAAARTGPRTAAVEVSDELPFVGFSVQGTRAAPRVRVSGPRGERFTSRVNKATVKRDVVIVPIAAEKRTFVFVKAPSTGTWRVKTLGGQALRELRTAEGLPKPAVTGTISGRGPTRTLAYTLKAIPGQQVTFLERTKDGVAKPIGNATKANTDITFTPASTGQDARIDAVITQNGYPRDTITVARFTATPPGTAPQPQAKTPNRPRRVRATRSGPALTIRWTRVTGATRYRVDILQGTRRLTRRTTTKTRLRLARVPAARLRIEVRALGQQNAASPARTLTLRPARKATARRP